MIEKQIGLIASWFKADKSEMKNSDVFKKFEHYLEEYRPIFLSVI